MPPTLNLASPDPALPPDFRVVTGAAEKRPVRVAMSNSFGFGGTNCSLVFASAPPFDYIADRGAGSISRRFDA